MLTLIALLAELWINSKALAVRYEGQWYFPTYAPVRPGSFYGLSGSVALEPTDYRALKQHFAETGSDDRVILPLVPYSPNENNEYRGFFTAAPPSLSEGHLLGTDITGRDVFARLVYGYRIAIFFAIIFSLLTFLIGSSIGVLMGYLGGLFDLIFQRLIEIWSNIPFLYMVIVIFSIIPTAASVSLRIAVLLVIMVLFSWTGLSYYTRTETYREKARDYASAAVVTGAGTWRILFHHILPNTMATLITFMPFTVVSAIASITALDFLGWGLPEPTPSLGELLKQGTETLTTAPWIVSSAFFALVLILVLVSFVGEAVREALDPKQSIKYS